LGKIDSIENPGTTLPPLSQAKSSTVRKSCGYLGSFWDGALIYDDFKRVFEKDEELLVRELVDLPRCAAERKVNQMVNRIRLVKVHVCLLGALSRMTPRLFGKRRSRARIMVDLDSIMGVRVEFGLSRGDMPDPEEFARCLNNFPDFSVFPSTDRDLIEKWKFPTSSARPIPLDWVEGLSSESEGKMNPRIKRPSFRSPLCF